MIRVHRQPASPALAKRGYVWAASFGSIKAKGVSRREAIERLRDRLEYALQLVDDVPPPELLFRVDSVTGLLYRTGATWRYALYVDDARDPEIISEAFDFVTQARDSAKLDAAWRYRHRRDTRGCDFFSAVETRLRSFHLALLQKESEVST